MTDETNNSSASTNYRSPWNIIGEISPDVKRVMVTLTLFMSGGILLAYRGSPASKHSITLLWVFACFAIGSLHGFLFGIPRVLQDFTPPTEPQDPNADTLRANSIGRKLTYTMRVNTNLEQISDWLTKIIVGLGLINLKEAPQHIARLSRYIANSNGTTEFSAGALFLYFTILGFLGFYLLTRLYISGALERAETLEEHSTEEGMPVS